MNAFKINEIYEDSKVLESYLFEQKPPYEAAEKYISNLEKVISKIPKTFYEKKELVVEVEEVEDGRDLRILLADDVLEKKF